MPFSQGGGGLVTGGNVVDETLTDADIAVNAAIQKSKINFGTGLVNAELSDTIIHEATLSLTAAQFKTLTNAVTFELVPAPGANKIIIADQIVISFNYVAPQYTLGDNVVVYYDTTTLSPINGLFSTSMFTAAANSVTERKVLKDQDLVTCVNKSLLLRQQTGQAFATGNGTVKVFIRYRVIAL